jgi:acylphosphatase
MQNERWEILFSGHVQGVGFRFQTFKLAQEYTVTGWVANLPNGQVQLVVEGSRGQIRQFIDRIQSRMSDNIRSVETTKSDPTGVFEGFEIRR